MKAAGLRALAVAAAVYAAAVALPAQDAARRAAVPESIAGLTVLPVQGDVYMIAGAGGNISLHVTDEGALVVDSGAAGASDRVLAAVAALSRRPIRYIINTSADADHIGGNQSLSKAGQNLAVNAPGNSGLPLVEAPIIAREEVLLRMSAPTGVVSPVPFASWPTSTFFTGKKTMAFGREPIELLAAPAAHTDGDALVWFRRSDAISVGDVYSPGSYPVIDRARGGSIQGVLDALNRIIDITIPRFNQQDGTMVIPGHGRLSDEADVVEYRDMATIVRDRIALMVKEGRTLSQVRAARPTLDYDGVYGAATGPWTTDMFIEAVYLGVSGSRR
jgi:glyoxylase-like metal-dependent hydrolase (beta-lactamase superfamily II)